MADYLVAIDLGTSKIVTIVGEEIQNSKYIKIIAYDEALSSGIIDGQVENVQNVVKIVESALIQIKDKAQISEIKEVYVGIAGKYIQYIKGMAKMIRPKYEKLITEEEIKHLEQEACKQHTSSRDKIIHAIPQTYSIDGIDEITDPVGRLGNKLQGKFIIITDQNISTTQSAEICMNRLNLSVKKYILTPIAAARAVLSEEEKDMGVAMVDMGGGTTDVIVFKDKILRHIAIIPSGGNIITQEIKKGCNITFKMAENIKIRYGSCLTSAVPKNEIIKIQGINGREPRKIPLSFLSDIIEEQMIVLIYKILSEINQYSGNLAAGIVFTGGGSNMKNLSELVQNETGMGVRIGKPVDVSEISPKKIISPKYSTAIGLIMCGLDSRTNEFNENNIGDSNNKVKLLLKKFKNAFYTNEKEEP
jgi:cell division protein FtsA